MNLSNFYQLRLAWWTGYATYKQTSNSLVSDASVIQKIKWVTGRNHKHFLVDENNNPIYEPSKLKGKANTKSPIHLKPPRTPQEKVERVFEASDLIKSGKTNEVMIPSLRKDLEEHGGSSDVWIIKETPGNARGKYAKGISHIEAKHPRALNDVLRTVALGKKIRFIENKQTVWLKKGNYLAVLSLRENHDKNHGY